MNETEPALPAADRAAKALERLGHLHPKLIDLSLGRMHRLLAKLGHPERRLPPVLHVAGTNGKGSVVATARAIAEAAGLRAHVYTSPHLIRFNERIRLAGQLIDDDSLADLLDEIETAAGDDPITFFEVTTAAAFHAFAQIPADLAIIEVGLGGRLDATNVIDQPAACAITSISYDHQDYLGDTLEAIAGEKAGIMKGGVPVIVSAQTQAAEVVLRHAARDTKAQMLLFGRDWRAERMEDERLHYRDGRESLFLPLGELAGAHQAMNMGTAIALMRYQRAVAIPEAAIRAGLGWVRWPARLQRLEDGPLAARVPDGGELWLDGGHNPAAGLALAHFFRGLHPDRDGLYLICGMVDSKDHEGFLKPFAGRVEQVQCVSISRTSKPAAAGKLAQAASAAGLNAVPASGVASALDRIATEAVKRPVILICGSLYLAGDVLKQNGFVID